MVMLKGSPIRIVQTRHTNLLEKHMSPRSTHWIASKNICSVCIGFISLSYELNFHAFFFSTLVSVAFVLHFRYLLNSVMNFDNSVLFAFLKCEVRVAIIVRL